jgi:hypothetical protein
VRRRGWGKLLSWLALSLLLAAFVCVYKSFDDAVTAEEGLNYSIPGMRGDSRYSPDDIRKGQAAFQQMDRHSDLWMIAGVVLFSTLLVTGVSGYRQLRFTR